MKRTNHAAKRDGPSKRKATPNMTANALACKQSVANNNNETKRHIDRCCKIETESENRRWLADFRYFDKCVANNLGLDQTWRGRKQSA